MDPLESKFQAQQMRELPHNLEAEQSLLGALMLNNECFEDISDIIAPTHFFVPINGEISGHTVRQCLAGTAEYIKGREIMSAEAVLFPVAAV